MTLFFNPDFDIWDFGMHHWSQINYLHEMKKNIMTLVRSIFPQSFLYKLRSFNTTNCDQG